MYLASISALCTEFSSVLEAEADSDGVVEVKDVTQLLKKFFLEVRNTPLIILTA